MAFLFTFKKVLAAGPKRTVNIGKGGPKRPKKEVPLSAYEKKMKEQREHKAEEAAEKKRRDKERQAEIVYNRFTNRNNIIFQEGYDPNSGQESDRPKAGKPFALPVRGSVVPGRHDIPKSGDEEGWKQLFEDIDGTYRFGSGVLSDETGFKTQNEDAVRTRRRAAQNRALEDSRVQWVEDPEHPEGGALQNFKYSDVTLTHPKTKVKKVYSNVKVFNKPRTHHREFPGLDDYLESNTDHIIRDRDGNMHSLALLAKAHKLSTRGNGFYFKETGSPEIKITPDAWMEMPAKNAKGEDLKPKKQLRPGWTDVTLPIHHRFQEDRTLQIPDSEIPDPHTYGVEGARKLLTRLKAPFTVEDIFSTPTWQTGFSEPKARPRNYQHINDDEDPTKSTVKFSTDVNATTRTALEDWNQGIDSGQGQTRGDFDAVWENEHGEKRNLKSYIQHLGDSHDAFANLKDPRPSSPERFRTHLDPTTAHRDEVEDLIRGSLSPEHHKALGQLNDMYGVTSTNLMDQLRLWGAHKSSRAFVPGLDTMGLDNHRIEHQLNGKTVNSTLGRFLEHHLASEAHKDLEPGGGPVMVNPAYSTPQDLAAIIKHSTNGEVRTVRDYLRLHLAGSPDRHKAVDFDVSGQILPTRNKVWGSNTLYQPVKNSNAVATRNLDDVFTSMGGSNLHTRLGVVPPIGSKSMDIIVQRATKGQFNTADEYHSALSDAVDNGGDLTPFQSHHIYLGQENRPIANRETPLPRRKRTQLSLDNNDAYAPTTAVESFPLATMFRPALVRKDVRGRQFLPSQVPAHIDIPEPDLSNIENEKSQSLYSKAEADNEAVANFGKPLADTGTGVVVTQDRHNPARSNGSPGWVTTNTEHSCPQCSKTFCTKCNKEVARNKVDARTGEHKWAFQNECLGFQNSDQNLIPNP